jgi:outer membrane protein TolC
LIGSVALNGRNPAVGDALSDSYSAGRPTALVGLQFSMPLHLSDQKSAREGATRQSQANEYLLQQRQIDQENAWIELTQQIEDAKQRLKLARTLEKIQTQKLENERAMLRQGRSTTFQILQFQQDAASAELSRAQITAQLINLKTTLHLYAKAENEGAAQ